GGGPVRPGPGADAAEAGVAEAGCGGGAADGEVPLGGPGGGGGGEDPVREGEQGPAWAEAGVLGAAAGRASQGRGGEVRLRPGLLPPRLRGRVAVAGAAAGPGRGQLPGLQRAAGDEDPDGDDGALLPPGEGAGPRDPPGVPDHGGAVRAPVAAGPAV